MISVSPWIFTTDNCNLRCPYCFEQHINNTMSEEVWSAICSHFITLMQQNKIDRTFFRLSGGEPLLVFDSWREFPPYMQKTLKERYSTGVITNLTLLTQEIIDYLVTNKIGCGISLDGTIHSKVDIHGNSTSKKVMENIEWYLQDGGVCNILTVLSDTNTGTGEILDLAKFIVKHNLSWQINSDIFVQLANDCTDQMYDDIIEAIQYLTKSGYDMSKFNFQFIKPCTSHSSGCVAGKTLFSISTNGDIYPCQTCRGKPISNILTTNSIYDDLKKQTLYPIGYNYEMPEECISCDARFHCKGSCKLNMTPDNNNPKCQLIRKIHRYFVDNGFYSN